MTTLASRPKGYEFPSCSFYDLPGALPATPAVPTGTDAGKVATDWLDALVTALKSDGSGAIRSLFLDDAFFRDQLALTGNFRCFHTGPIIAAVLSDRVRAAGARDFAIRLTQPGGPRLVSPAPHLSWVEGRFTFHIATPAASCSGSFRLVYDGEDWRAWTLSTVAEQLDSFHEVNPYTGQPLDIHQPSVPGKCPFKARRRHQLPEPSKPIEIDVAIFGAGAAGLSVAGRCEAWDLSHILLDRYTGAGENWSKRYDKAIWHTAKHTGALPYQRMADEHPFLMGRLAIAEMLTRYVDELGLNFCGGTRLDSATWSEDEQRWTLTITRDGQTNVIYAKYLVQCTGTGSQVPYTPDIPGRADFKGVIKHSVEFQNAEPYKGKRVIVVGSANTAHDIVEDFLENGASEVTMIQRSPTYILPCEYICDQAVPLYNETFPSELADRMLFTSPQVPGRLLLRAAHTARSNKEPNRYDGLDATGFRYVLSNSGGDISETLFVHAGRHYIDTGATARLIKGDFKVKSDSPVARFTPEGLAFEDGTNIGADVVVFCTGFSDKDMSLTAKAVLDSKSASKIGPTWGIDEEAEVRGLWRPSGHPNLFFHGGGTGQCRFFSRHIVLQIKAAMTGQRFPLYTETPSAGDSNGINGVNGTNGHQQPPTLDADEIAEKVGVVADVGS